MMQAVNIVYRDDKIAKKLSKQQTAQVVWSSHI